MELLHCSKTYEIGRTLTDPVAVVIAVRLLSQPLGAAANFGNAARRLLASGEHDKLDKLRSHINAAVAQVLRAGQILRRLHDFVSQGETDKRIEDVEQIIADASALALVGPQILAMEVSYQLDPDASLVFVDKIQIQQVLVNLMRNAVEAMAESPRRSLTVTTRLLSAEMVEIAVADTGPGLRRELIARLFQPFVTTKRRGMGLGLSICRTIVEAHGGRLWRDSNPLGGTVFRFSLPAAPELDKSHGG
jgi:two-component system, LuxR family, sensor kinase FixL